MTDSILCAPYFHDEEAAYGFVEARLWPTGPVCPRCGVIGNSAKLRGKSTRIGVYKCRDCRKPFTVKIGTIFEDSHIPMRLWLQAIFLVAASKKGISANQLHRTLGVTRTTAWHLGHRIRLAMAGNDSFLMGTNGKAVEADETYYGRKPGRDIRRGHAHKETVFSLVERGGQVRSTHITGKTFAGIKRSLRKNVSPDARLMTDDARLYKKIAQRFAEHQAVNHSAGEYVRGDAHTNTVEGYFSVFKRGMTGVYQHCDWKHLHRYLAEFDFRYNNRAALEIDDQMRTDNLLRGVSGKRLTYETVGS